MITSNIEHGLSQDLVLKKLLKGDKVQIRSVGKVEFKIACMIIYYTILGVMGLVVTRSIGSIVHGLRDYILCESGGQSDCVLNGSSSINANRAIVTTVYVMISLIPVLALFLSFSPQACRRQSGRETSTNIAAHSMSAYRIQRGNTIRI